MEQVENAPHRRRKVYQKIYDPFSLRDVEFKQRYHFNKHTASFIIDLVKQDLQLDSRGCGSSQELQVQDDWRDLYWLTQPTMSRICARAARAVARHSETYEYIKIPQSLAEEQRVIREFLEIRNFLFVLGCIDCTHIKIKKFGGDAAQYYINRKGCYSLNGQTSLPDSERGSTHDSRIFNESTLKERFEKREFRGRLLGDSGYRLEPYLFTAILRPLNEREEKYNRAQIATRNCVERCFGVWKQRFQSLLYGMTVHMKNVKPTIVALAVLHNIAIGQQNSVPDHDDELMQLWMLNFYLKLVRPEEETPIMLFYEHLSIGILAN